MSARAGVISDFRNRNENRGRVVSAAIVAKQLVVANIQTVNGVVVLVVESVGVVARMLAGVKDDAAYKESVVGRATPDVHCVREGSLLKAHLHLAGRLAYKRGHDTVWPVEGEEIVNHPGSRDGVAAFHLDTLYGIADDGVGPHARQSRGAQCLHFDFVMAWSQLHYKWVRGLHNGVQPVVQRDERVADLLQCLSSGVRQSAVDGSVSLTVSWRGGGGQGDGTP